MFNFQGIIGLIHLVLFIYTLYVLFTGKKPKNLSKVIWAIIIIILPLLGPILYWIIEKDILK